MEIRYTHHAEDKLADETFAESMVITKDTIGLAIVHPDHEEVMEDGKIRAVGILSNSLSLVVIYKDLGEYFLVITFWPAKRGRYER